MVKKAKKRPKKPDSRVLRFGDCLIAVYNQIIKHRKANGP